MDLAGGPNRGEDGGEEEFVKNNHTAGGSVAAVEYEVHLDEVVRRPGTVEVEGEVVVEEGGGRENGLFQLGLLGVRDEQIEIGHLVELARRRAFDFGAAGGERLLQLFKMGLAVVVEDARSKNYPSWILSSWRGSRWLPSKRSRRTRNSG